MPLRALAEKLLRDQPEWRRLNVCIGQGEKEVQHPFLFAHPRTRQPGLILGKLSGFVREDRAAADATEVASILAELDSRVQQHAVASVYRHEWQAGDVILVDNLAVAHLASSESMSCEGLRVLHRIVVAGVEPLERAAPSREK